MITWEQEQIRTVDDLLCRDPLRGHDPRTGVAKTKRRWPMIGFRIRGQTWTFDRRHVHKLAASGAELRIDRHRLEKRLDGMQLLAWKSYWPCPDPWCLECSFLRDATGVGPLDSEVAGVADAIWFRQRGPSPYFYVAPTTATTLQPFLMRARTLRHPVELAADLIPAVLPTTDRDAVMQAAVSITNIRAAERAMPAEYYAKVFAAVESGGWYVARANSSR